MLAIAIAAFVLLEGLTLMGIALVLSLRKRAWLAASRRAWGHVLELREETDRDGAKVRRPVIAFRDNRGQDRTFASRYATAQPQLKLGARVEVLYQAANPDDAEVAVLMAQWGMPIILGIAGILSLASAPVVYLSFRH